MEDILMSVIHIIITIITQFLSKPLYALATIPLKRPPVTIDIFIVNGAQIYENAWLKDLKGQMCGKRTGWVSWSHAISFNQSFAF